MGWKLGDRVVNLSKREWGVGLVSEVRSESVVRVWFEHYGYAVMAHNRLETVHGEDATRDIQLPKSEPRGHAARKPKRAAPSARPFEDYRAAFVERFPQGFNDPGYMNEERTHHLEAGTRLTELLGADRFRELLAAGKHDEICAHALAAIKSTTLIFPNEKTRLRDGLKTDGAAEAFSTTLHNLLYADTPFEERFMAFAAMLEGVGAATWTVATYFPFLSAPQEHMFLKPTVSQRIAASCEIELNYDTKPNWTTYKSLLTLCTKLNEQLADLSPRDHIDLQSFMWCTAR